MVEEDVDGGADWVEREVAGVFGEGEDCKRQGECDRSEGGLYGGEGSNVIAWRKNVWTEETTHIDGDTGYEQDDRQTVKELPPNIETDVRPLLLLRALRPNHGIGRRVILLPTRPTFPLTLNPRALDRLPPGPSQPGLPTTDGEEEYGSPIDGQEQPLVPGPTRDLTPLHPVQPVPSKDDVSRYPDPRRQPPTTQLPPFP